MATSTLLAGAFIVTTALAPSASAAPEDCRPDGLYKTPA